MNRLIISATILGLFLSLNSFAQDCDSEGCTDKKGNQIVTDKTLLDNSEKSRANATDKREPKSVDEGMPDVPDEAPPHADESGPANMPVDKD